jgi:hypothetical protein
MDQSCTYNVDGKIHDFNSGTARKKHAMKNVSSINRYLKNKVLITILYQSYTK